MSVKANALSNQLAASEFVLSRQAYDQICKIVRTECGIELRDNKMGLVKSRLQRRLRQLGLQSFSDYVDLLSADTSGEEIGELVSAISTNVTNFNREPHHFDHLRNVTLPPLIERLKRGEEVRFGLPAVQMAASPTP